MESPFFASPNWDIRRVRDKRSVREKKRSAGDDGLHREKLGNASRDHRGRAIAGPPSGRSQDQEFLINVPISDRPESDGVGNRRVFRI
jgi:hypothetical protein